MIALKQLRSGTEQYECAYQWPPDAFLQCGPDVVGTPNAAFFEVSHQDTYIASGGATIEDAEAAAWRKFQRQLACPDHDYERRGYDNGVGFCRHCDRFKVHAFPPDQPCQICGVITDYSKDLDGLVYCKEHRAFIPVVRRTETHKRVDAAEAEMAEWAAANPELAAEIEKQMQDEL